MFFSSWCNTFYKVLLSLDLPKSRQPGPFPGHADTMRRGPGSASLPRQMWVTHSWLLVWPLGRTSMSHCLSYTPGTHIRTLCDLQARWVPLKIFCWPQSLPPCRYEGKEGWVPLSCGSHTLGCDFFLHINMSFLICLFLYLSLFVYLSSNLSFPFISTPVYLPSNLSIHRREPWGRGVVLETSFCSSTTGSAAPVFI